MICIQMFFDQFFWKLGKKFFWKIWKFREKISKQTFLRIFEKQKIQIYKKILRSEN